MAEGGEEKAAFVALKNDAQQALPKAAEQAGSFADDTAEGIEKGLDAHATNETELTDDFTKTGKNPPEDVVYEDFKDLPPVVMRMIATAELTASLVRQHEE